MILVSSTQGEFEVNFKTKFLEKLIFYTTLFQGKNIIFLVI